MITDVDRARVLQAAALCLGYPDDAMLAELPLLAQAAAAAPTCARKPLQRFVEHVSAADARTLTRDYVDTFDLRRRCCLYLTYYSHGDTRKRGTALVRFTTAYRLAGIELAGDELPDHLAVVCEVAARAPQVGLALLADHRAGVELLRIALDEAGSAYVHVLDAIRAVLPDAAPADLALALQLAGSGPPEEEVGLEPFAPPEYMGGRR